MTTLYLPSAIGRAAFEELDRVKWDDLAHAYGAGKTGPELSDDVAATLEQLGHPRPGALDAATYALFSNLCHQGTIYEATAYAVPFLVAFAAGELTKQQSEAMLVVLASIGTAAACEASDGSHAGSWGPGVAVLTREAFRASRERLTAAAARHPFLGEVVDALLAMIRSDVPDLAAAERLDTMLNDLD